MQTLTPIEKEVNNLIETNKTIVVNSQDDLSKATACIKGIKGLQKQVEESYDPIIEKAHQSHKEAIAQKNKFLKPLKDMEDKFKQAILTYNKKVESEQAERIKEANERLAKVAEEKRLELLQESQNADNAWDKAILQEKSQEVQTITVDAPKKAIEQEGLSIRKTWKARVIDEKLVPRMYMEISLPLLNSAAKIECIRKEGVPGVKFYQEESASVRV